MLRSMECSLKKPNPSKNRVRGIEPGLLKQNAIVLPLAPPPLPYLSFKRQTFSVHVASNGEPSLHSCGADKLECFSLFRKFTLSTKTV